VSKRSARRNRHRPVAPSELERRNADLWGERTELMQNELLLVELVNQQRERFTHACEALRFVVDQLETQVDPTAATMSQADHAFHAARNALLALGEPRRSTPGCRCTWEPGDTRCPVHDDHCPPELITGVRLVSQTIDGGDPVKP
jgi:hypothetical protein